MALLVTLAKFKEAIGEISTDNDSKHTEAIEDASAAILGWTDRDFGTSDVTEDRTYRYDGSGFLEIDDTSTIHTVSISGRELSAADWRAGKDGPSSIPDLPYSYLELPRARASSGEMGFTRNLDVWLANQPHYPVDVVVNATWGWLVVPDDVQRATIWTAAAFEAATPSASGSGELESKSVAEVAESYLTSVGIENASAGSPLDEEPLPRRVRGLLYPYRRHVL